MNRLRILQAFFGSILLVAVVVFEVRLFAETYWTLSKRMIDDLAVMFFMSIAILALVGSLWLNVRLLAGLRPTFDPSSRLLPQVALLAVSVSLLYLITTQGIILCASYDPHLSRYYLVLGLPGVLSSADSFSPGASVSVAGDGTQVVAVFLFLMTSNLAVGIYNTGWRSRSVTAAKCLTSTLVFSHITVGLLVAFWAVIGMVRVYRDVQGFTEAVQLDPDVMNSSNLASLAYRLLWYLCLGVYAQWLLRDGWSLCCRLKRGGS